MKCKCNLSLDTLILVVVSISFKSMSFEQCLCFISVMRNFDIYVVYQICCQIENFVSLGKNQTCVLGLAEMELVLLSIFHSAVVCSFNWNTEQYSVLQGWAVLSSAHKAPRLCFSNNPAPTPNCSLRGSQDLGRGHSLLLYFTSTLSI